MGSRSFFELARWSSHLRRSAKLLNSSEDAHLKSMSTFEMDEHLRVLALRVYNLKQVRNLEGVLFVCRSSFGFQNLSLG